MQTKSILAEAVRLHQQGRLEQAALLYQRVLEADPEHPDALHLLGTLALQNGQAPAAVQLIGKSITLNGRDPAYHFHLALALRVVGDLDGAVASFRWALVLRPNDPDTYNNMGNVLAALGKFEDANACFRRVLAIAPNNAEAHNNLGNVLWSQGNGKAAESHYRSAIALAPDYADAHANMGNIHRDKGELEQAVTCYRQAVALTPNSPIALNGLGLTLWDLGRRDQAVACYRQTLALDPNQVEALANLGIALWSRGALEEADRTYRHVLQLRPHDPDLLNNFAALLMARGDGATAMQVVRHSLRVKQTRRARKLFVALVRETGGADDVRDLIVQALTEPWGRPGSLSKACAELIKSGPLADVIAQAAQPRSVADFAKDEVLIALLTSAPNSDVALERFLTLARRALLETALADAPTDKNAAVTFASALAQQCFINDYVFAVSDDELTIVEKLRASVTAASPALQILALACYAPLPAGLEDHDDPALAAVLTQQIHEPREEQRLRAAMPQLTKIADPVSRAVQAQYEEHPYPRWVRLSAGGEGNIAAFLGQKYPLVPLQRGREMKDFLIAGCGTGQQSISAALKFGDASMLAVDLSLESLAYARRKSEELGLAIEYGQADILELPSLGRQFDVIEATGVLHHMADPFAGWRALLACLRPGGVMWLGFYSEAARRDIAVMRARIAERGIGSSADDIRRFRQEVMEAQSKFASLVASEDFFSISACRDLLFHTQEQGMTLEAIAEFLKDQKLTFVGFEVDEMVHSLYRQRYPDDPAATDLANWAAFEQEKPMLFASMYVFWIQKP